MSNCILYARFSPRPNSNDCDSVDKQIRDMEEYCVRYNHIVTGTFSDEALSGSAVDRPGLWDCINALKRGYVMLIYSWDRLARDTYLSEIIQMQVKKKGCSILSITQEDTSKDTPESKLVRTILLAIAEYQRQILRARTRAAMLRFQKEGRRMCSPHLLPYGRMTDPDNPALMIDNPAEQTVIKRVIELHMTGISLRAVAKKLIDAGFEPRRVRKRFRGKPIQVKGTWRHNLVKSILDRVGRC